MLCMPQSWWGWALPLPDVPGGQCLPVETWFHQTSIISPWLLVPTIPCCQEKAMASPRGLSNCPFILGDGGTNVCKTRVQKEPARSLHLAGSLELAKLHQGQVSKSSLIPPPPPLPCDPQASAYLLLGPQDPSSRSQGTCPLPWGTPPLPAPHPLLHLSPLSTLCLLPFHPLAAQEPRPTALHI